MQQPINKGCITQVAYPWRDLSIDTRDAPITCPFLMALSHMQGLVRFNGTRWCCTQQSHNRQSA